MMMMIMMIVCVVLLSQWPTGYGQAQQQQSGQYPGYSYSQWNPATAAQTWPGYSQQGAAGHSWPGYSSGGSSGGQYHQK